MISQISTYSLVIPALANAFGIATTGPIPIISGATPAVAKDKYYAIIGSFSFSAVDLLAKSTMAAPSVT